jgi:hypothetical protein
MGGACQARLAKGGGKHAQIAKRPFSLSQAFPNRRLSMRIIVLSALTGQAVDRARENSLRLT